jgi:hypothetical protein
MFSSNIFILRSLFKVTDIVLRNNTDSSRGNYKPHDKTEGLITDTNETTDLRVTNATFISILVRLQNENNSTKY